MGETNLICPECNGERPSRPFRGGFCCEVCMNAGKIYYTGEYSLDRQPQPERQTPTGEAVWSVSIKLRYKATKQYGAEKWVDARCGDVKLSREGKTFIDSQGKETQAYSGFVYAGEDGARIDLEIVEPTVEGARRKVARRWIEDALRRAS